MLLWAGLFCIASGMAAIAIDRRAIHHFYDRVGPRFEKFLYATTHFAKAAHWLGLAVAVYAVCWAWLRWGAPGAGVKLLFRYALAFILSLGVGSAVLHAIKLVIGRRRPRDELEMSLYGFVPFAFSLDKNSFPSGHSLTIACVAVIAAALWPMWSPVWFALALWLALTRALLAAHFLSDVLVGFGIGLVSAREVLVLVFPQLAQPWF